MLEISLPEATQDKLRELPPMRGFGDDVDDPTEPIIEDIHCWWKCVGTYRAYQAATRMGPEDSASFGEKWHSHRIAGQTTVYGLAKHSAAKEAEMAALLPKYLESIYKFSDRKCPQGHKFYRPGNVPGQA